MTDFLDAVVHHRFMFNAVLTGVLASVASGVVGTYVVTRRITYLAGGIAHSVLGGMGIAYYLSHVHGYTRLHPLHGAIVAGLIAAALIGLVSLKAREREDTVIGALWATGMAVGVIFIAATPGYNQDIMSYLFGNILLVSSSELWLVGVLDLLVVSAGLLFYNQLLAVCFDEEFARVRGLRVELYYLLLLGLTALTIVILANVVGIILVIALLTLPAAIAGHFTRTMWQMMALAVVFSTALTLTGLGVSYQPNLPAGATIVLVAAGGYLVVVVFFRLRQRIWRA
ncbi:MAG: metal ABC transporter permease [Candidatus Zixiibacteriota bacterium]